MEFAVNKNDFIAALGKVGLAGKIRGNNATTGEYLWLHVSEIGEISMFLYNGILGIFTTLEALVDTCGGLGIPYTSLFNLINSLSEDKPIKVTAKDNHQLIIKSGKSTYKLPWIDEDQVDEMPGLIEADISVSFPVDSLINAIGAIAFCAAPREEAKAILQGVNFITDGNGEIALNATDQYRVGTTSLLAIEPTQAFNFTLPVIAITAIQRLIIATGSNTSGIIELRADDRLAQVEIGNTRLVTSVMADHYPPIARLYDWSPLGSLLVDRQDLAGYVRRLAGFGDTESYKRSGVTLQAVISGETLIVSVNGQTMSGEEVLDIESRDKPISLAIRSRYLLDILNRLKSDRISISYTEANKVICIDSVEDVPGLASYLLMPVLVSE